MRMNHCPGSDGYPVEFYRCVGEDIKIVLYNVYQEAIINKSFHLSARRGLISLMEKLGRDILWIDNWRCLH